MSMNLNVSKSKIKAAYKGVFPAYKFWRWPPPPVSSLLLEELLCPCGNETLYDRFLCKTKWEERGDMLQKRSIFSFVFNETPLRSCCSGFRHSRCPRSPQKLRPNILVTGTGSDINLTISCTREKSLSSNITLFAKTSCNKWMADLSMITQYSLL